MPFDDVADEIRDENDNQPSVEDQVTTGRWFYETETIAPLGNYKRTNEVKEAISHRLDHKVRGVLDNLEEIGVLEQDPRGGGSFIRHERSGDIFHSPDEEGFLDRLEEEIARFFNDLANVPATSDTEMDGTAASDGDGDAAADGGKNIRTVAADGLGVPPALVEDHIESPDDPLDQMGRFDDAVGAIKEDEDVERGEDYDQMGWGHAALRWALSEQAYHTANNHSLDDFED